jgi:cubilin
MLLFIGCVWLVAGAGFYANGEVCNWTLTADINSVAVMSITSFSTETCCDFLTLYDGASSTSPVIVTLSGSLPTIKLYWSSSRVMHVTWRSNAFNTFRGFVMNWYSDIASRCRGLQFISGGSGVLRHPQPPATAYADNEDCKWVLTADVGLVVQLTIVSLASEACWCGALDVRDALPCPRSCLDRLGHAVLCPVVPCLARVLVYARVCSCSCGALPSVGCTMRLACTAALTCAVLPLVPLTAPRFAFRCRSDSLQALDGNATTAAPLGTFSGVGFDGTVVTSRQRAMQLRWKSDNGIGGAGFRVSWQSVVLPTPTPTRTPTPSRTAAAYTGTCSGRRLQVDSGVVRNPVVGTYAVYANNEACQWRLQATAGTDVVFTLTEMRTADSFDRLTISAANGSVIAILSGTLSGVVVTSSGIMELRWESNNRLTSTGFSATWVSRSPSLPPNGGGSSGSRESGSDNATLIGAIVGGVGGVTLVGGAVIALRIHKGRQLRRRLQHAQACQSADASEHVRGGRGVAASETVTHAGGISSASPLQAVNRRMAASEAHRHAAVDGVSEADKVTSRDADPRGSGIGSGVVSLDRDVPSLAVSSAASAAPSAPPSLSHHTSAPSASFGDAIARIDTDSSTPSPAAVASVLRELLRVVASDGCAPDAKAVVIAASNRLRARHPEVWTDDVPVLFGQLLTAMSSQM